MDRDEEDDGGGVGAGADAVADASADGAQPKAKKSRPSAAAAAAAAASADDVGDPADAAAAAAAKTAKIATKADKAAAKDAKAAKAAAAAAVAAPAAARRLERLEHLAVSGWRVRLDRESALRTASDDVARGLREAVLEPRFAAAAAALTQALQQQQQQQQQPYEGAATSAGAAGDDGDSHAAAGGGAAAGGDAHASAAAGEAAAEADGGAGAALPRLSPQAAAQMLVHLRRAHNRLPDALFSLSRLVARSPEEQISEAAAAVAVAGSEAAAGGGAPQVPLADLAYLLNERLHGNAVDDEDEKPDKAKAGQKFEPSEHCPLTAAEWAKVGGKGAQPPRRKFEVAFARATLRLLKPGGALHAFFRERILPAASLAERDAALEASEAFEDTLGKVYDKINGRGTYAKADAAAIEDFYAVRTGPGEGREKVLRDKQPLSGAAQAAGRACARLLATHGLKVVLWATLGEKGRQQLLVMAGGAGRSGTSAHMTTAHVLFVTARKKACDAASARLVPGGDCGAKLSLAPVTQIIDKDVVALSFNSNPTNLSTTVLSRKSDKGSSCEATGGGYFKYHLSDEKGQFEVCEWRWLRILLLACGVPYHALAATIRAKLEHSRSLHAGARAVAAAAAAAGAAWPPA
jgi:hypothetical protein